MPSLFLATQVAMQMEEWQQLKKLGQPQTDSGRTEGSWQWPGIQNIYHHGISDILDSFYRMNIEYQKFHGELGHLDDGSTSRFVFMPTVLSMVQPKKLSKRNVF